jgi:hypothetical protein
MENIVVAGANGTTGKNRILPVPTFLIADPTPINFNKDIINL